MQEMSTNKEESHHHLLVKTQRANLKKLIHNSSFDTFPPALMAKMDHIPNQP